MNLRTACGLIAMVMGASIGTAYAQHDPSTPLAVAAKVALRGDANGIAIREARMVRRNDILSVQADMANVGKTDRTVFYRYKWLDSYGNQVGDGESWKQIVVMGLGQTTVKSVAPSSAAVDFRIEMNVEGLQ